MKHYIGSLVLGVFLCTAGLLTAAEKQDGKTNAPPVARQTARTAPDWVNNGIIYQINPRAFTKEGTLPAATAKMEELARLGVTIVYFCPVFVADDDMRQEFWSPRQKKSGMNNPRNPYRMKDYYNVDPEYGTNDDLKTLVAKIHSLGMKVMLDMVYLHCGPTAVFMKDHPDFVKRNKSGKAVNAAWSFPGLNFENAELREYLYRNMEYWVRDFGVDGFRLDVADGVPLDFWEESRRRLEKIRPDVALFAEGIRRPDDQLVAFDLNYGFSIYPVLKKVMDGKLPASAIVKEKQKFAETRPKGARLVHYIDNHDISNDDYEKRREHCWGTAGVEAALALCLTLDGVPMIYNGQEIADKTRHSIFGKLAIDWSKANSPEAVSRYDFCQKLIRIRKENKALQTKGNLTWLDNSHPDKVLSFERSAGAEKILVVINMGKEPVSVEITSQNLPKTTLFSKGATLSGKIFPVLKLEGYGVFMGR